MKIFYFLLLSTAVFCLNNEQINSTEFQKKKQEIISIILKKYSSYSMPLNYNQYVQSFNFSGNIFVDVIPHDSIANQILKFGLPENEDWSKRILNEMKIIPYAGGKGQSPLTSFNSSSGVYSFYNFGFRNLTLDKSISLLILSKAKTVAKKKQLYGTYRIRKCKVFLFFKKCHYENEIRKREYTTKENENVKNAAIAYTFKKLEEKLDPLPRIITKTD